MFRRLLLLLCCSWTLAAGAQAYPSKAVRIVAPFPVGSSADVLTRQPAHLLSAQLKQPFVVDNRPGANGMIGAASVARAQSDGYTLLYANSHVVTVNPHINAERGFDPLNELEPIMIIGSGPTFLVVPAASPYRSVQELIAAAERTPGKLSYGTSGMGSAPHGTPQAVVRKLNEALRAALHSIKDEIAARGSVLIASSPEDARTLLQAEYKRYGELVKALGLARR